MSESSSDRAESGLPLYRVELETEGIRRVHQVRAASIEEALVRVREPGLWPPGGDHGEFRVVEVSEENASSEVRHQRNARRRYLNTIVEAGLAALGKTVPERPDEEFSDFLCDFFTRAVVLPGRLAFPAGGAGTDRLMTSDDVGNVLAGLLVTHLAHHGLEVSRTAPE